MESRRQHQNGEKIRVVGNSRGSREIQTGTMLIITNNSEENKVVDS
jgi:hypothetical protein